nr:ubiquitin thioesterase zranb1-B-like [Penaeus vannamei]
MAHNKISLISGFLDYFVLLEHDHYSLIEQRKLRKELLSPRFRFNPRCTDAPFGLDSSYSRFYPRWKEYERWQARLLDYYVPEGQVLEEWAELICLASQPGAALEQLHIFVLAHILRRPVIVYGVKCVKSFRGEDLGFARFEGVYLPLLWEPSFCWKSPIALGYTRGHFCALVPMEPDSPENMGAGAILDAGESQVVFLPLMTQDAKLLPVHFLTQAESREKSICH